MGVCHVLNRANARRLAAPLWISIQFVPHRGKPQQSCAALAERREMPQGLHAAAILASEDVRVVAGTKAGQAPQPVDGLADLSFLERIAVDGRM
jgi:hypothetical protein